MNNFEFMSQVINDILSIVKSGASIRRSASRLIGNTSQSQYIRDQSDIRNGKDIPSYMTNCKSGFFFGEQANADGYPKTVLKPAGTDGNICCFGRSADGKTSSLAIPTLKTWEEGIVAVDLDGELVNNYHKIDKRPFKVLNLMDIDEKTCYYDPFHIMKQSGEDDVVRHARALALAIIPLPPETKETFWIEAAENILTAALIYHFNIGSKFIDALLDLVNLPFKEFIGIIKTNVVSSMFLAQFKGIEKLSDNKMVDSVIAELHSHIIPLVTNLKAVELFTPNEEMATKEAVSWCYLTIKQRNRKNTEKRRNSNTITYQTAFQS